MRIVECGLRIVGLAVAMGVSLAAVFGAERTWTRSEILAIADKEARRLGYDVEHMDVALDVYNSKWNDHLDSQERVEVLDPSEGFRPLSEEELRRTKDELLKDLKDRNFWAVYSGPLQQFQTGGDLWIFIDRNTGEVIKTIQGK